MSNRRRRHIQAAALEFLAAATRARLVAADPSEWISVGFALRNLGIDRLQQSLAIGTCVVAEPVPPGQFLHGVAEQGVFVVLRVSGHVGMSGCPFDIVLEMLEAEPLGR